MGRDGNYWGHNAIIRTKAFAAHCGLPVLRGRPPFGGHILSHDFVEAALIRRAGYAVYMLPSLGGSYEECPPSLIDLSTRDRRWCQGNLQHLRVLPAKGLHPMSRQHFVDRHHGLCLVAALDGATYRRYHSRLAGKLHQTGIFLQQLHFVSGLAEVRSAEIARPLRPHHDDPAAAQVFRACSSA